MSQPSAFDQSAEHSGRESALRWEFPLGPRLPRLPGPPPADGGEGGQKGVRVDLPSRSTPRGFDPCARIEANVGVRRHCSSSPRGSRERIEERGRPLWARPETTPAGLRENPTTSSRLEEERELHLGQGRSGAGGSAACSPPARCRRWSRDPAIHRGGKTHRTRRPILRS